ncbi:MAG: CCA tRNA nucleotidyltransferase [Ignisphaera sp.]
MEEIFNKILARIKPDERIRNTVLRIYDELQSIIHKCFEQKGLEHFEVTLQGSVAKDTFLRDDVDIDIFILFNPSHYTVDWINKNFVEVVSQCLQEKGYSIVVEYASHPYIITHVDGYEINIVPAFKISKPSEIISAVDRTPFHTEYVKAKLCEECKDEVRLLKYFLKVWNMYGAEIKTRGFSGYLTELLIIKYGSFINTLKASLSWRAYKTCIDIEGYYVDEKECRNRFRNDVLVIVDPVDANRNVASALSLKNFAMFKLLARLFLENPSENFFEMKIDEVSEEYNQKILRNRIFDEGLCYIAIKFDVTKKIPDVVWGQIRRIHNSIRNTLNEYGFRCTYIDSWVDPALSKAITIVELYECREYEYHIGPPAYDPNAVDFLIKNRHAVIGPWIDENGRLVCIRKRRKNPEDIVKEVLEQISPSSLRIAEITRVLSIHDVSIDEDKSYMMWLKRFLERKILNY